MNRNKTIQRIETMSPFTYSITALLSSLAIFGVGSAEDFQDNQASELNLHLNSEHYVLRELLPKQDAIGSIGIQQAFAPFEDEILAYEDEKLAEMIESFLTNAEVDGSCPGSPYVWKIIEDATGSQLGFALGVSYHSVSTYNLFQPQGLTSLPLFVSSI